MDFSGLVWVSLLIPILIAFIALVVFYFVIRLAVAHGLRDHFVWRVQNRERYRQTTSDSWSLLE